MKPKHKFLLEAFDKNWKKEGEKWVVSHQFCKN